jgi:hypothetical protein
MTRFVALLCLAALPSFAVNDRAGPWEVQVLIDGMPARTFHDRGETFVLGQLGERYTLRVVNHSAQRIEAVVSVDGRDVIDGKPATPDKRGYLVPAFGTADIDGWRISQREAAAFRFSTVPESYAARTGNGREVGVIGVAIFPERYRRPIYAPPPPPRVPMELEQPRSEARGNSSLDSARSEPAPAAPAAKRAERPGLGTEFGEAVSSNVTEVPFERARPRPDAILGARYNDRAGLIALGIDVDGDRISEGQIRGSAEPFPVVERGYAQPPPGWRR